jgi:MarR family 2-MHQ and catechol resistance regulon transcriptional repressor
MSKATSEHASAEAFIPLMQELAGAYQAYSLYDAEGLRRSGSGLTPSQARVIFTIGGTEDRLEEKGLVERWSVEGDGRKTIVALTRRGQRVYEREYPRHVEFLKSKFGQLGAGDRKQATRLLQKIRGLF